MRRYLLFLKFHKRISALLLSLMIIVGLTSIALAQPINNFGNFVLNTRADLEVLGDKVMGVSQRPDGWTFNINNLNSPTYIADLWYDQELLAEQIFGTERPIDWIGASATSNAEIVARNIRHDLEIAADSAYGKNNRPPEWRGGPAIFRCDRTTMDTVFMLQTVFKVTFNTPDTTVSFCQVIAGQAQDGVVANALSTPEIDANLPDLILALRGDLERLADEQLGLNNRPANWIGNKDKGSPTLLSDAYLDLETLANDQLGGGDRPDGWQITLPNAKVLAYRVLRYNLELLADALGRVPRPRGWQGNNPTETCDPQVQNLVSMAQQQYNFSTESVPVGDNFCQQLSVAANAIVESPPQTEESIVEGGNDQYVGESQIAFSYLDSAATQYMGMMPAGTKFKAWYRNFGNSSMMFVSGENFAVYIDRRWTTLPADVFSRLPTTEGVKPLTFCDASWCNGPGPTPTPTGFGAIQALLNAGTPPAPPDVGQVQENKRQVSWNNIRVTYLLDNVDARTSQVALEICTDTSQTTCEPVILIFDNATGANKPVLSQSNGLNVYEFPYGYSSNLVIQSATLFSPDIWISDPTIR